MIAAFVVGGFVFYLAMRGRLSAYVDLVAPNSGVGSTAKNTSNVLYPQQFQLRGTILNGQ